MQMQMLKKCPFHNAGLAHNATVWMHFFTTFHLSTGTRKIFCSSVICAQFWQRHRMGHCCE